ncbi:hypothetical protein IMZ48_06280 [Candidatus Bathyarchaeota archaeon]|nr:hypothetical protein [Candidatus Bathyarchaeota archaeon]
MESKDESPLVGSPKPPGTSKSPVGSPEPPAASPKASPASPQEAPSTTPALLPGTYWTEAPQVRSIRDRDGR